MLRSGSYNLGSFPAQTQRLITIPLDMPSDDYAIVVSNATVVGYWTKMQFSLSGRPRRDGFDVLCYNDASSNTVSNAYFRWLALWVR